MVLGVPPSEFTVTVDGVMSGRKQFAMGVASSTTDRQTLRFFVKQHSTATQADLAGTWHSAVFADAANPNPNNPVSIVFSFTLDTDSMACSSQRKPRP